MDKKTLRKLSEAYSETEMMKAQDILMDIQDAFEENGQNEAAKQASNLFDLLTDVLNLDA